MLAPVETLLNPFPAVPPQVSITAHLGFRASWNNCCASFNYSFDNSDKRINAFLAFYSQKNVLEFIDYMRATYSNWLTDDFSTKAPSQRSFPIMDSFLIHNGQQVQLNMLVLPSFKGNQVRLDIHRNDNAVSVSFTFLETGSPRSPPLSILDTPPTLVAPILNVREAESLVDSLFGRRIMLEAANLSLTVVGGDTVLVSSKFSQNTYFYDYFCINFGAFTEAIRDICISYINSTEHQSPLSIPLVRPLVLSGTLRNMPISIEVDLSSAHSGGFVPISFVIMSKTSSIGKSLEFDDSFLRLTDVDIKTFSPISDRYSAPFRSFPYFSSLSSKIAFETVYNQDHPKLLFHLPTPMNYIIKIALKSVHDVAAFEEFIASSSSLPLNLDLPSPPLQYLDGIYRPLDSLKLIIPSSGDNPVLGCIYSGSHSPLLKLKFSQPKKDLSLVSKVEVVDDFVPVIADDEEASCSKCPVESFVVEQDSITIYLNDQFLEVVILKSNDPLISSRYLSFKMRDKLKARELLGFLSEDSILSSSLSYNLSSIVNGRYKLTANVDMWRSVSLPFLEIQIIQKNSNVALKVGEYELSVSRIPTVKPLAVYDNPVIPSSPNPIPPANLLRFSIVKGLLIPLFIILVLLAIFWEEILIFEQHSSQSNSEVDSQGTPFFPSSFKYSANAEDSGANLLVNDFFDEIHELKTMELKADSVASSFANFLPFLVILYI